MPADFFNYLILLILHNIIIVFDPSTLSVKITLYFKSSHHRVMVFTHKLMLVLLHTRSFFFSTHSHAVTPLTPMANLKVLIAAAAASSALERECASSGRGGDGIDGGMGAEDRGGRKMKSLSVLCQR